jgi:hypothetical protein
MSDDLHREIMKWKNRYREERKKNEQTQSTLNEVESVINDLDTRYAEQEAKFAQVMQPDDKDKLISDLQSQLVSRDRRDEWRGVVGNQLHQQVPMEELWTKAGYMPTADPLTPEQIAEHVAKARDAAPYLFTAGPDGPGGANAPTAPAATSGSGATAPRPAVGVGGGQGGVDRGGLRVTISREQLTKDPKLLHRPDVRAAHQAGNLTIVD